MGILEIRIIKFPDQYKNRGERREIDITDRVRIVEEDGKDLEIYGGNPIITKMMYNIHRIFLLIFTLTLINCGDEVGQFGFAKTHDEGKTDLELDLAKATEYKMMREKIIFSPRDTIHYVYLFSSSPLATYSKTDEFSVSLEKESLGFVEIDLKKKYMNAENKAIQDKFKNLEIGHYIMKISFEGELIDSVYFDVVPDEGYSLDDSEENSIDSEKDEIVRYSK